MGWQRLGELGLTHQHALGAKEGARREGGRLGTTRTSTLGSTQEAGAGPRLSSWKSFTERWMANLGFTRTNRK